MDDKVDPGVVGAQWWRDTFGRNDGKARRVRAVLRRAVEPLDVLLVRESHDLNRRLGALRMRPSPGQLAAMAMVLAHVERDGKRPIAAVFGEHVERSSRPRLSERRFDRLVRCANHDELLTPMRRSIGCIGNAGVSVELLARDIYRWGPMVAGRWCYQYHGENSSPESGDSADVSTEES